VQFIKLIFSRSNICVAGSEAGLPDGLLSDQKLKFGKFFRALKMEGVSLFYGPLVYFTAI
jgi:hypothetical protein